MLWNGSGLGSSGRESENANNENGGSCSNHLISQQRVEGGRGRSALRLCSNFDVDRARPGFLAEWQLHGEHAVLVLGADLRRVHRVRQRKRTVERSVVPLDTAELLFLDVGRHLPDAA